MNKKFFLFLILFFSVTLPYVVFGVSIPVAPRNASLDIAKVLTTLTDVLWNLFIGFAIIMFIFAAYTLLSSRGNPGKVKSAMDASIWGIVGLVVGMLAWAIPKIIISWFP